jgi:hypothetical protein
MWFATIGALMILASLLAPRFRVNLYHSNWPGRPGRKDNSLYNRVVTALIGVLLILFGFSDYYPK